MGRHQIRLLQFALKYPNDWHTYGKDRSTVNALKSLANMGFINVVRETRQFKLNIGSNNSSYVYNN